MMMASLENAAPVLALEDKQAASSKGSSPNMPQQQEDEEYDEDQDEDRKVGFGSEDVVEIEQASNEHPSAPQSPSNAMVTASSAANMKGMNGGKGFKPVDLNVNF